MESIYIPDEDIFSYGENTARTLPPEDLVPARAVEGNVKAAVRLLIRERERLHKQYALQNEMPESARWLLDNLYLAQREGQDACALLHRTGRLRAHGDAPLTEELCKAFFTAGSGSFSEERFLDFLEGFQQKTVLTGREIRLLPAMLRAAAIVQLSQVYKEKEPDAKTAGALFSSLRQLSLLDMEPLLSAADRTEQLLLQDPAGIYPQMDERSRREYRCQVERLARSRGMAEHRAAQKALRLSARADGGRERHVGYYLYEAPLGDEPHRRRGIGYMIANVFLTLGLTVLVRLWLGTVWAGILVALPFSGMVKEWIDQMILHIVPPRRLPRLSLEAGVPPEGRTICVISVLLTGEKTAKTAVRHLEEYALASRDCRNNLLFGLLCDLPESKEALSRRDKLLTEKTAALVEELNRKYGGGFYLLCRERVWSRDSDCFSGWERKRGAVTELARLLSGETTRLYPAAGDALGLRGVSYILTLDSDTRLEPEAARELIGTALHPLNMPVVDPHRGIVTAGHGILHPRIAVGLESAQRTAFARIFSPQGGGDPYGCDAGEVSFDLFARGGFAGKGLIHVQSFLECMEGRIAEGRVLSHDALEGAFLRGGYVSDVELTDGFPARGLSWFARQHRWIRGDWQNLGWIFRAGRDLPVIERWKLMDSLRRSLIPPALLAGLCAGLIVPNRAMITVSFLTLLTVLSSLLAETARTILRPEEEVSRRLFSGTLHGLRSGLLRALARLWLLPYEAWTSLSAIAAALWRMKVSHKKLLQWQTAEQSEAAGRGGLFSALRQMWPELLLGAALLFTPTVIGKAVGVLWLLSPLFTLERKKRKAGLPAEDRDWLLVRAAEVWRYFRDFCTPQDHFLPPDNYQASPPVGLAHRSSPTNMGLALTGSLCALELGIATPREALGLAENLLSTMERLPKWQGHLYNWYDTHTLRPLPPEYVSTVDSGNLWASLLASAEGLRVHGAPELAQRADALRLGMDFRPLYDRKRCLFRIGCAPGEVTPAKSWYDLLESEERLTGYLAIASGQIPRKHWQHLGRAQVALDGFRGMVSWTGSMFEYLMPEIFLPLYKNSHLYETARFAVYAQRKRTAGPDKLWGMSESAFYALDSAMNYRYKAHGVGRLALCRGMDREKVIAPYSSFLALLVSPRAAMTNLRRMYREEYTGPYGLWEAIDFTPERSTEETGMPVRCVMAHHLGMSLAAITNVLCDNVLQHWFVADPAMAAYTGLLQEKVPLGGALLHRREDKLPERPRTMTDAGLRREGDGTDFLRSAVCPLSNGIYSLLLTETGRSRPRFGTLMPYREAESPMDGEKGVELTLIRGEDRLSLLPESREDNTGFHWRFTPGEAVFSGEAESFRWEIAVSVGRHAAGERRRVTLWRTSPGEEELELSLEPTLLPPRDYRAHPSFARLGLSAEERDGMLLIRRLPRGGQGEMALAVAADRNVRFSTDRRGEGVSFWQSECRVRARVTLPAGEEKTEVSFAVAAASDGETVLRDAGELLRQETGFPMAADAGARLGMENGEVLEALETADALAFPAFCAEGAALPPVERNALWALGVSGDLPIAAFDCPAPEELGAAEAAIRCHALLRSCGIRYDLVFLVEEEGDYRQPCRRRLENAARRAEPDMVTGEKGGIHFVSFAKDRETILSAAAWCAEEEARPRTIGRKSLAPPEIRRTGNIPPYTMERETFTFAPETGLPPRCWGNMLTNGTLSWFATDAGTGALWYKNARECPVTPWMGDPLAGQGREKLWAEVNGKSVSFFADGQPGEKVTFSFGAARWEKESEGVHLSLTAFIPPEHDTRVFLLKSSEEVNVFWCAPVQLAPEREDASSCRIRRDGGLLTAENVRCAFPDVRLYARSSAPWDTTLFGEGDFLMGATNAVGRSADSALCGSFRMKDSAVILLGTEDVPELRSAEKARALLEETKAYWRRRVMPFTVTGGDPALCDVLNGWSLYEALAGRLLGRSSPYQSGGAIGFRDQLQDAANLLGTENDLCRNHILTCCAHQFSEGDVQHWWHPGAGETDKGVRTRCSDDLLWLPWALCRWVEETGDESLCYEKAVFLTSPALEENEHSRYELPTLSGERDTVLEHCRRSIYQVLSRGTGRHRLLLMGGGDWNDGFDAMGEGAESVWLSFFASTVLHRFSLLLQRLGQPEAENYEKAAAALGSAANGAWDGDHYLRGWYGNGEPLGAHTSPACRIDSVAQSFAAFCPYADPDRADTALTSALRELWDRENHLLLLYAPPFTGKERAPGYVETYGPGFRENGGQYTHAAVWLAAALFRRERWEEGAALLSDITAAAHGSAYGAEPFVIPADIYSAPGQKGRAGWSWYTGAAGWFFRTAMTDMLGLSVRDGKWVTELSSEAKSHGWKIQDKNS